MARFLIDSGVLFQHIPRAGGTWIESALYMSKMPCMTWIKTKKRITPAKHSLLSHYHKINMPQIKHVVVFIRHPVDYYEAVWRWLRSRPRRKRMIVSTRWDWHPHKIANDLYTHNFNDWVFLMLKKEPMWVTRMYEGFVGPPGGEFCDYIGRTETLCRDFLEISKIFGFWREIKPLSRKLKSMGKVHNNADFSVQWDEGLREEVRLIEKPAIDRFYGTQSQHQRIYSNDPEIIERTNGKIYSKPAR